MAETTEVKVTIDLHTAIEAVFKMAGLGERKEFCMRDVERLRTAANMIEGVLNEVETSNG